MAIQQSTAADPGDRAESTNESSRLLARLVSIEPYLWTLLVVVLLADVLSTFAGLQAGMTEGNPAMRMA
ncbi:MAG: hypothetical protein ACOCY1_02965, partial [Halovenus sp.]